MIRFVRRSPTYLCVCALAARLLAACGDGTVVGQDPTPYDGGTFTITRDSGSPDVWTELYDDVGNGTKGNPDAVSPDAPRTDAARADASAPDPCATRDDGLYCAALLGLPTPGLLRCRGSRSIGVTECANGCLDRAGATDACLDDTIDPCFNERDGLYCGRTIGSARPGDAFRCMYRRTTWTGTCPGGCAQGATGVTCTR